MTENFQRAAFPRRLLSRYGARDILQAFIDFVVEAAKSVTSGEEKREMTVSEGRQIDLAPSLMHIRH
jgi:hypothetical protein